MIKASAATTLCLLGVVLSACTHIATPLTPAVTEATPDSAPPNYATALLDRSTPEATAYSLMIAMYRGDTAMADAVFAPDGELNRLSASGEIRRGARQGWQDWVGTLEVGQAREDLFDIKVEQFGRLATVWAPFTISIDGELRGCGVNSFTMVDMGEDDAPEWRI
ncbi:MAG: hypothetical protein AAF926_03330, partial [Pseudomonadota bacterium]